MNNVDVTFVFKDENSSNYARTKKDGNYSKEIYSIDELMKFLIAGVDERKIKKGFKKEYGKSGSAHYTFNYIEDNINTEKKEKESIKVIIPGKNRDLYKNYEKQLDSLISINTRLKRGNVLKVASMCAAGIVLVTFATAKVCKLADEEFKANSEKSQEYVQQYPNASFADPYNNEDTSKTSGDENSKSGYEYNMYLDDQGKVR